VEIQQLYEDVALGMIRRNQISTRASKPLKSMMIGRMGLLFDDHRRAGRT
jgi:hypothetical protein